VVKLRQQPRDGRFACAGVAHENHMQGEGRVWELVVNAELADFYVVYEALYVLLDLLQPDERIQSRH
jgi:hypothetical protein